MSAAVIFGIVFLIILVAAILFLILWLNKKSVDSKTELAIEGVVFKLSDIGPVISNPKASVTATWTSTGSSNNIVNIYADTTQIKLDKSGVPTNPKVLKGGPVSGQTRTVSVSGLKLNTTYFLKLVVTNSGISGSNNVDDIVYTGGIPQTPFIISELQTTGGIATEGSPDSSGNLTVVYSSTPGKSGFSDIWSYDSSELTLTQTGVGKNSKKTYALYDNNSVLEAKDLSVLKQENSKLPTAQWIYNRNENNQWCLLSDPNKCLHLDTATEGVNKISVSSNSASGWKNVAVRTN